MPSAAPWPSPTSPSPEALSTWTSTCSCPRRRSTGCRHALQPLGLRRIEDPRDERPPIAGIRFEHIDEPFPVDVFPALDVRYHEIERRRVLRPFGRGDDVLPFLSAEDLCLFKLSYGRPKDWVDLAAVAAARSDIDVDQIEDLLVGLRGPSMYPDW